VTFTVASGSPSIAITIRQGQEPAMSYVGNLPTAANGTASVASVNVQGGGTSALPVNQDLQQVANTALGTPVAWGSTPTGVVLSANVNCVTGCGGGSFTWPGTAGNAAGGTTTAGTMPYVNAYLTGALPAFAATPTFNLGTLNGAATSANQTGVQSAPGTPQTTAITIQGNASGVAVPVSGTFSATVVGFAPNGNYLNASVATTTANSALPTGAEVVVYNNGANPFNVKLGTSNAVTVTASTGDTIGPGSWTAFAVGSNTYIAYIGVGGTSTIQASGGSGIPTGGGVGSSGSICGTSLNPCYQQPNPGSVWPASQNGTWSVVTPGIIQSSASVAINISTATTTQLVALSAGKAIYVSAWDVIAAGTGNVTLEYGTGTNCGTGTTALTGAYPLTAQAGISKGDGSGTVLFVPAGNALCVLTSAAVQMSGSVAYAQF
jgi:hypothetical protein